MHQPHEETNDCKNRPGLFRVGWMHLLGILCVIFFFLLLGVCLVRWGYAEKLVLVSIVLGSAFLNPVVWNLIDRLAENNERERTQLLERLEEQQYILKEIWRLTESVADGQLFFSEVQSLFFQSIRAFYLQRQKPTDQIPKVALWITLRDIFEDVVFWPVDKFRSLLRRGLHSIIYYLSSLFYPQRLN